MEEVVVDTWEEAMAQIRAAAEAGGSAVAFPLPNGKVRVVKRRAP